MLQLLPLFKQDVILQKFFFILFLIAGLLLIINKLMFGKRYDLNIRQPNVYVFTYEAQAGKFITLYNILNLFIKFLAYLLFGLSLLKFYTTSLKNINFNTHLFKTFITAFLFYIAGKFFIEAFFLMLIKQSKFIQKIRLIRNGYENYVAFYLIIAAFLIFYLPVKSVVIFYVIISISTILILIIIYIFYRSLKKHVEIKTYQIFLYLCMTEILPLLLLTGWIIFQIL